jgi:flagellar hook-associated protein 3 FlgL
MRISTIGYQTDALTQMEDLQAALAQTQNQLGSGKQIRSAADDPAGMAQVNQLNAQLSASQQYVTNGNVASTNLKLEEQGLTDATSIVQSARDLALQANSGSVSASQRADIATQLQQMLQQLVAIGNRTDSNGGYLFAGVANGTSPFSLSGNSVSFNGSTSVSQVEIAAGQSISSGDSGESVFMNLPAGNGTFATSAAAANTGAASITPGTVTDPAAWVPDTYTITFTSPTQYQVTDSANNPVSSGTLSGTGSDTIAFRGIQVDLSGAPATGDTFTVAPAGKSSVFGTLSSLITTLQTVNNPAQLATQIGGAIAQIDTALNSLSTTQASVGSRLDAIASTQSMAQSQQLSLQTTVSQLSDLDYAAAITKLNTEMVSLQASQQSYAALAKLSLFNYIQ